MGEVIINDAGCLAYRCVREGKAANTGQYCPRYPTHHLPATPSSTSFRHIGFAY